MMRFLFFVGCITLLPLASYAVPVDLLSPELATRQSGSSWFLPNLDHSTGSVRGFVPDLVNSAGQANFTYPVYKSVNSGDSQGFIDAITSDGPSGGARDNCWLAGQPRVIYLSPGKFSRHVSVNAATLTGLPGTYTLSSTVFLDTDTVIIGDAANPPTIRAASGFSGNYLLVGGQGDGSAHPCGGSGGETHFSVMSEFQQPDCLMLLLGVVCLQKPPVKNVILDTTANSASTSFTALSWAIAQNCALVR
jgi:hypothetical protein